MRFRLSGVFGMSSMMCGVSHTVFMPSASYPCRISRASSTLRTPSSTAGRMCECQSVKPSKSPLSAREQERVKGHMCGRGYFFDPES